MLCGNCKKNQATKTYEWIKKERVEISYYCLECYQKLVVNADEADGVTPYAFVHLGVC